MLEDPGVHLFVLGSGLAKAAMLVFCVTIEWQVDRHDLTLPMHCSSMLNQDYQALWQV
jgi:hypothetical protein